MIRTASRLKQSIQTSIYSADFIYSITSAALPAQSQTIQAVLVSAQLSMVICSFHKLEQLGSESGLTNTSPVLPVHQTHQFRAELKTHLQTGLSLTFPLRTFEEN